MRPVRAAAIAGLCGFASMCMELTAVRLLAPHFGDSVYVWTNVIGVILAALAAGAFWGGRMVDAQRGEPRLLRLLLLAAIVTAAVPLLAAPLGSWLLPQQLPLDAATAAMVRGSLFATMVLFGLPVLVLGATAPLLVSLLAQSSVQLGRALGTVSACGTLGSLLGTFAATHVLVPGIGCRATLWTCAVLLATAALLVRGGGRAVVVLVIIGASLLLQQPPLRQPGPGLTLLAERESRYQYLQVVRSDAAAGGARTELQINEGLDSFHSVAVAGSALTGGCYYDYHMLPALLAGDGARPPQLRALSIGDAAGTFRSLYAAVHPGATVDGVEIDPAVVQLGDEFFAGRRAPGELFPGLDGRLFVDHAAGRWHVIHVDAYAHQAYIPPHLASVEFFTALRARLEDGGVVACNVGGLRDDDPVLMAIARTLAEVFGRAWAMHLPQTRNFLLLARAGKDLDPSSLQHFEPGAERLSQADASSWAGIVALAAQPLVWHQFTKATPAPLLTDDVPRLDRLLRDSYLDTEDSDSPVPIGGGEPAAAVETAALAALRAGDHAAVLRDAAKAAEATPFLRLLCGDARWQLRQLQGAGAEYRSALALAPAGQLVPQLQQRLRDLGDELAPHQLAAAVTRRNTWLALVTAAVLLCWCALLLRPRNS